MMSLILMSLPFIWRIARTSSGMESLSLSRRRDEFLRTKSDLLGAYSFKGAFEASPPMRDPREVMESDLHLN